MTTGRKVRIVPLAKMGFKGAGTCGVESGGHSYSDQEMPETLGEKQPLGGELQGLVFSAQAGADMRMRVCVCVCVCVEKTPLDNMYLLYFWSLRLSRPKGLLG